VAVRKWQVWAVALASTVSISPYGPLSSLLNKDNPWKVFRADDPILTAVRAQVLSPRDCESWITALSEDRRNITAIQLAANDKDQNWGPWLPLESKELDAIQDCSKFPCNVKFDAAETEQMKKAQKGDRAAKFLALIWARARDYQKSEVRKPYEFPGGITDPWAGFEKRGLKSDLAKPATQDLGVRVLDFKQSRVRPIRQLLDRRVAISSDRQQASIWLRDVYTDHYFDGWGEWASIQCEPAKHDIVVTMALSIELDLLKKTDLFSSLAKGSMRDSVRKLAIQYLDDWWTAVRARAEDLEKKKTGNTPAG
jgi:hypothetical protein